MRKKKNVLKQWRRYYDLRSKTRRNVIQTWLNNILSIEVNDFQTKYTSNTNDNGRTNEKTKKMNTKMMIYNAMASFSATSWNKYMHNAFKLNTAILITHIC